MDGVVETLAAIWDFLFVSFFVGRRFEKTGEFGGWLRMGVIVGVVGGSGGRDVGLR